MMMLRTSHSRQLSAARGTSRGRCNIARSPSAYAVGIDLGTSTSCVAVIKDGRPVLVDDASGPAIIPSVVAYNQIGPGGAVGFAALRQARMMDPASVFYSVKRLIGRKFAEVPAALRASLTYKVVQGRDDWALLNCPATQQDLQPEEVSSLVLGHLVERAAAYLGVPVAHINQAVITVPAHFNHEQKAATLRAARMAGLKHVSLLQEPVAAALANGFGCAAAAVGHEAASAPAPARQDTLLVVDLGGGTFDVSILDSFEGIMEVLATSGDNDLGGDDFTLALQAWLTSQLPAHVTHQLDDRETAPTLRRMLWDIAETTKVALTRQEAVCVDTLSDLLMRATNTTASSGAAAAAAAPSCSPSAATPAGEPDDAAPPSTDATEVPCQPGLLVSRTLFEDLTRELMARLWPPLGQVAQLSRLQFAGAVPAEFCNVDASGEAAAHCAEADSAELHAAASSSSSSSSDALTTVALSSATAAVATVAVGASMPVVAGAAALAAAASATLSGLASGADRSPTTLMEKASGGRNSSAPTPPAAAAAGAASSNNGRLGSAPSSSSARGPAATHTPVVDAGGAPGKAPAAATRFTPPPRRLTGVVLSGAGTRMHAVQRYIKQLTGLSPSNVVEPEVAVALGAALQAGVLAGVALAGRHGGAVELMDGAYIASAHQRTSSLS